MEVKVTIVPAKHWFDYAKFRTEEDLTMAGITVPKGYVSDGATVPRWLTAVGLLVLLIAFHFGAFYGILLGSVITLIPVVFPKTNMYFAAALVHDYYITKKIGTRRQADKIFRLCLKQLNVQPWRYNAMYIAVRVWGILLNKA